MEEDEEQKDIDEKLDDMELSYDSHPHNIPSDSLKIKKFKQTSNYRKIVSTFTISPNAKRIGKRIGFWCIIATAILIVLLIYFAIFELLKAAITGFGATIVLVVLHFMLFRLFCKFSTYPGSYKIWLREVEYKFGKDTTHRVVQHISKILSAIETLTKEEIDLDEFHDVLEVMQRYRNQSRIQNTDHALILTLHEKLQKTKVSINCKTTTLWDIEAEEIFDGDQSNQNCYKIKFEDYPKNQIAINLIKLCFDIINDLKPYGEVNSICKRLIAPFKYKPFGRLDQMRNELEVRFDGKQTWATSFDGKKIDGMLIPAVQNLNATITDYKSCPTMMIGNPNAGFYEYFLYQSEWLSYINIGINVAIWNYRGYGRSQGTPTPQSIRKDGEYVLKHFVEHFGLTNLIGVHGESLGGSVAGYIARTCKVDFLFANRTFSRITDVPLRAIGPIAKWMYTGLTGFHDDVASDFVEARGYKVVGCDPQDHIINELCSLKVGISQKLIEEANGSSNNKFKFSNYFHIISKDEGNNMQMAIEYILDLNKKMQIWKNYNSNNKVDDDSNNDKSDSLAHAALHQSERNEVDFIKLDSSLTKHVNSEFKSNNKNNTVFVDVKEFEVSPNKPKGAEYLETGQDVDLDEKFLQITNPGVSDNSFEFLQANQQNYSKVSKYLKEQENVYLEKSNYNSLGKILIKIHRILEKVDSAGVSLTNLFANSKRNRDFGFQMFFINIDIWGSQKDNGTPLRKNSKDQIELARITLERCVALMKNEKGKIFETVRYKTILLLNCFEKISKYLVERNKSDKNSKSSIMPKNKNSKPSLFNMPSIVNEINNANSDNENLEDDDKFETIDLRNSKPIKSNLSEENKLGTIRDNDDIENNGPSPFALNEYYKINHSYFRTPEDPRPDVKGHLIIVKGGHNGNFNIEEKNMLEKHLSKAGFMNSAITG